jgi:hypothetical protein
MNGEFDAEPTKHLSDRPLCASHKGVMRVTKTSVNRHERSRALLARRGALAA